MLAPIMPAFSFKKDHRISKSDTKAKRWRKVGESEHFSLFQSDNDSGLTKFGVVAGKKTGNAVRRNRIKRIAREFFRLNKGVFPKGKNVLIKVKKIPEQTRIAKLQAEFFSILKVGNSDEESADLPHRFV